MYDDIMIIIWYHDIILFHTIVLRSTAHPQATGPGSQLRHGNCIDGEGEGQDHQAGHCHVPDSMSCNQSNHYARLYAAATVFFEQ